MNPITPNCTGAATLRQNTEQFLWRRPSSSYKGKAISWRPAPLELYIFLASLKSPLFGGLEFLHPFFGMVLKLQCFNLVSPFLLVLFLMGLFSAGFSATLPVAFASSAGWSAPCVPWFSFPRPRTISHPLSARRFVCRPESLFAPGVFTILTHECLIFNILTIILFNFLHLCPNYVVSPQPPRIPHAKTHPRRRGRRPRHPNCKNYRLRTSSFFRRKIFLANSYWYFLSLVKEKMVS